MRTILKMKSYILFLIVSISACATQILENEDNFEATIEAQSTQLAVLHTQVVAQEQTNWSQWDAISCPSTQMPLARGLITSIPEDLRPTLTPWIDIEYSPNTRTGNPEIDRVIDGFMANNLEARTELVRLIQLPCTTADRLGGPPKCEGDEIEGTIVTVFPVLYTEGAHVRPDDIRAVFDFTF